jgi:hypothetical protein
MRRDPFAGRHRKPRDLGPLRRLAVAAAVTFGLSFAFGASLALASPAVQAPHAQVCASPAGVPGQWRSGYPDGPVYVCDEYGAWVHVQDLSR